MSYQEYAHLRNGGWNSRKRASAADATWQQKRAQRMAQAANTGSSGSDERPYVGSHASFSAPRPVHIPPQRTVYYDPTESHKPHSPSSSLSATSLSPSSSASQRGLYNLKRRTAAAAQEPLPPYLPKEKGSGAVPERRPDLVDVPLPWRPTYLQRRVLFAFLTLFITLGIALQAILGHSNQTPGLGPADRPTALRYAFQMLPVAVLLLVAGAWHRVEYQARSSAPWIRMARGASDAERTLLLDYVSMLRPAAVAKAVRSQDFVVACAITISLLLHGAIVVSTALVAPKLLTVTDQAAQIVVTSQFRPSPGLPLDGAGLSLAYIAGLQEGNMSLPDGAASRFAYQRFRSDILKVTDAQIGATVETFHPNLSCESATLSVGSIRASQQIQQLDATFAAPGCSIATTVSGNGLLSAAKEVTHFLSIGRGGCGGSTAPENQRVVVVFGTINIDMGSAGAGNTTVAVNGSVPQSTQLICVPDYTIKETDLVKDDVSLVANKPVPSRPQSRRLDGVRPWDLVDGIFGSYAQAGRLLRRGLSTNDGLPGFLPARVVVDPLGRFVFGLRQLEQGTLGTPNDYFNTTTLASLVSSYFQHHASILALTSLSSPVEIPVQGTSTIREDRLAAKPAAVHSVTVFLGVCVLLGVTMIVIVPAKGFLPRNPGTLMDITALLGHSRPLLQALRGTGAADTATLWERLGGAYFYTGVESYEQPNTSGNGYFKIFGGPLRPNAMSPEYAESGGGAGPWPQQPWMQWPRRLASLAAMTAIIAALEYALQVSQSNDGLANVDDGGLTHFVWTAAPAFLLMLLFMYVGLVDFTIRVLAPFTELARGGSYRTMTMNLVDSTAPFAMYEAFATKNWAAVLSTSSLFVASLLLVFVASAFCSSALPAVKPVQVQTLDFFDTGAQSVDESTSSDLGVLASLVLAGNATYPAYTYRDLVFPRVTLPPGVANGSRPDNAVITATLPAIRASFDCKLYTQSELRINLATSSAAGNNSTTNSIRIDIPDTTSSGGRSIIIDMAQATSRTGSTAGGSGSADGRAFIGAARFIPNGTTGGGTWLYGWGRLSNANTGRASVAAASALSCDEKMQRLSAAVSFSAPSMVIEDDCRPAPVPVAETVRDSSVFLPASEASYAGLANVAVPGPHHLDGFFSQLVSSRYAIPLDMLGGAGQAAESVAAAIAAQHGIVRAQALNVASRQPISATATPVAADSDWAVTEADSTRGLAPGAVVAQAQLQMLAGRPPWRRLRQDPVPTRVLEALLAALLAASAAAWLLAARANAGALPRLRRSPLSIASVGALLADGNLFGILGRGAEWKDVADLAAVFRDGLHVTMRFRLGWEDSRGARRDRRATMRRGAATAKTATGRSDLSSAKGHGQVFAISAVRTGGWGGGENVGLGLQARVGFRQRKFVRDWGWKT